MVRSTAAELGGKVHLNGQRSKPGKNVEIGNELRIHKGPYEWQITILELPSQRRPAKEAVNFYRETEESRSHGISGSGSLL